MSNVVSRVSPNADALSRSRRADKVCENRAPLGPTNSANVCYRGNCAYACNSGFAQQGDQCVATLAANQQCGGQTCDVPANGYALCTNGACEVGCNLGFTRYSTSGNLAGPYTCIDTANDASRCGTGANLVTCPASCASRPPPLSSLFSLGHLVDQEDRRRARADLASPLADNGVGTPECRNSVCRIACPTGSTLRRADSTSNPYYCCASLSLLSSSPGGRALLGLARRRSYLSARRQHEHSADAARSPSCRLGRGQPCHVSAATPTLERSARAVVAAALPFPLPLRLSPLVPR